jgi:hypothetical protein
VSLTAALLLAKTWGGALLGLLAKVDRRVWYALAVVLALLYYGNWSEERGRAEVRAEVAAAVTAERVRVQKADMAAIDRYMQRAVEARKTAMKREEDIDELKDRAKAAPGASSVCIPPDIADRLRDLS